MADCMAFPKNADEFIGQYKFTDTKQEYTNGAELIPVFRVKQMLEHYVAEGNHSPCEWIPVTDENPKEAGEYIVKIAYASAATALWYNPVEDVWFSDDYRDTYPVTHWMYMPEPPKGE